MIGLHAIAMTAPFDAAAKKAGNKNKERKYVANRPRPEHVMAQIEGAVEFDLKHVTSGQRGDDNNGGGRNASEQ